MPAKSCENCCHRGTGYYRCDSCRRLPYRPGWFRIECPFCGWALSEIRTNGPEPMRHCYGCHFDFPVDENGNARREVEEDGDR